MKHADWFMMRLVSVASFGLGGEDRFGLGQFVIEEPRTLGDRTNDVDSLKAAIR